MLASVTASAGHPVVAALLGLGAAGLAGAVVAMAWSVHIHQFRLAELLARRQFAPAAGTGPATPRAGGRRRGSPRRYRADGVRRGGRGHHAQRGPAGAAAGTTPSGAGGTAPGTTPGGAARAAAGTAHGGAAGPAAAEAASPVVIDGPDTVITGAQARYRARLSGGGTVVSWAVGGGSASQSPDPDHPDELLLIADRPGSLTVMVRVRKGLAERRATKTVTAEADVPDPAPPFTLRLFLHGWSLVVVAVLVIGLAGALVALGSFTSSDFIALAVPLIALLGMAAVIRGVGEEPVRPRRGRTPVSRAAESPWAVPASPPYAPAHTARPPTTTTRYGQPASDRERCSAPAGGRAGRGARPGRSRS